MKKCIDDFMEGFREKYSKPVWVTETIEDLDDVTRVEVINEKGRVFVIHDVTDVQFSLQDDNRTLKIFLNEDKLDTNANGERTSS